jgi:hypothetical protein
MDEKKVVDSNEKLKKLREAKKTIEGRLRTLGDVGKIKEEMRDVGKFILNRGGPGSLHVNAKKADETFKNLLGAIRELNELHSQISIAMNENESYELPSNFMDIYENVHIANVNFQMEKNRIYHLYGGENTLSLNSEQMSAQRITKMTNDLLNVVSGQFDLNSYNNKLQENGHNTLSADGINNGFGRDQTSVYFRNQCVTEFNRDANLENFTNIENFIGDFLKATRLPDSVKPNLMALLSTLSYQSGLPGFMFAQLIDTAYVSLSAERCGNNQNAIFISGGDTLVTLDFDSSGKLYVNLLAQSSGEKAIDVKNVGYGFEPNLAYRTRLVIETSLDSQNNPIFKLDNLECDISGRILPIDKKTKTPFEIPDKVEWRLHKGALLNVNRIDPNYFDPLDDLVTLVGKFAGFASLDHLTALGNVLVFNSELPGILQRNSRKPIGLKSYEAAFLRDLYYDYTVNKCPPNALATKIIHFFNQQLPNLPKEDLPRYVHLVNMALQLTGSITPEIRKSFSQLLRSCGPFDKDILITMLKSSMDLYITYQANKAVEGFLDKPLPNLTKAEHTEITNALQPQHFAMIAKHPELLDRQPKYKDYLQKLSLDKKFEFLVYDAKNSFYDVKNFFKALQALGGSDSFLKTSKTESARIMKQLTNGDLPELQSALHRLMLYGEINTLNKIRNMHPEIFAGYDASWPKTMHSMQARMDLLDKTGDEFLARFGNQFVIQLLQHLSKAANNTDSPERLAEIREMVSSLATKLVSIKESTEASKVLYDAAKEIGIEIQEKITALSQLHPEIEELLLVSDSEEKQQDFTITAESKFDSLLEGLQDPNEATKQLLNEVVKASPVTDKLLFRHENRDSLSPRPF